jgi:hypothetical protein
VAAAERVGVRGDFTVVGEGFRKAIINNIKPEFYSNHNKKG